MRMVWYKMVEGFDGLFGPVFLYEAYTDDNCHSDGYTDSIVNISHEHRSPSGSKQEKYQRLFELSEESKPQGLGGVVGYLIGSKVSKSRQGFWGRKAVCQGCLEARGSFGGSQAGEVVGDALYRKQVSP